MEYIETKWKFNTTVFTKCAIIILDGYLLRNKRRWYIRFKFEHLINILKPDGGRYKSE